MDLPIEHGGSFHSYVKLPKGIHYPTDQYSTIPIIIHDYPMIIQLDPIIYPYWFHDMATKSPGVPQPGGAPLALRGEAQLEAAVPGRRGSHAGSTALRVEKAMENGEKSMEKSIDYPLANVYITMERSTIFNGKIHYFNGHFQ